MKSNKKVLVVMIFLSSFACNLLSPNAPSDISADLAATQNALQLTQISIENLQDNDSTEELVAAEIDEPVSTATEEPAAAEGSDPADGSPAADNDEPVSEPGQFVFASTFGPVEPWG